VSHYHIVIPVSKEEVAILKKYFIEYLEQCGGITIAIMPFEAGIRPSTEMEEVIRRLFVHLLLTIEAGQFEALN
jgi:hypothetical protein